MAGDYGYQIAGIANRTSIADGNTWNHEHIANLARALTATEEGARVIRHLADYVLVAGWRGRHGKSPHLFRIGKSIGHDTALWTCTRSRASSASISTVAPLRSWRSRCSSPVSSRRCPRSVSRRCTSGIARAHLQGGKRERKVQAMARGSANRLCDAPGSWYCPGQYLPALAKFTGIIKPAYTMPAFAKQQMEQREAAKAKMAEDAKEDL